MEVILFIIAVTIFIAMNSNRKREIGILQWRMSKLEETLESVLLPSRKKQSKSQERAHDEEDISTKQLAVQGSMASKTEGTAPQTKQTTQKKSKISYEKVIGEQLSVWLGGIALAVAGFFMIKYSIDNNLMTPIVRVIGSASFGFLLLLAGYWIASRQRLENYKRISQSLIGAGIIDLFISTYVATEIYHFIAPMTGYGLFAVIILSAMALAYFFGEPIAYLSLLGSFVTPFLFDYKILGEGYYVPILVIFYGCLTVLAQQRQWWKLLFPSSLIVFFWLLFPLYQGTIQSDTPTQFSLLAMAGISFYGVHGRIKAKATKKERYELVDWVNIFSLVGIFFVLSTLNLMTHMTATKWFVIGFINTIALLFAYEPVAWVGLGCVTILLRASTGVSFETFALLASSTFGVSSLMGYRKGFQSFWTAYTGISAIAMFMVGHILYPRSLNLAVLGVPTWVLLGFVTALPFALLTKYLWSQKKQDVKSISYAFLTTITLLTLGVLFEFHGKPIIYYFISLEMLGLSYLYGRFNLTVVPKILSVLLGFLVIEFVRWNNHALFSLPLDIFFESDSSFPMGMIQSLLPQLAVLTIALGLSAWSLSNAKSDSKKLINCLSFFSLSMMAYFLYYLTRYIYHWGNESALCAPTFIEHGFTQTVAFGALALLPYIYEQLKNRGTWVFSRVYFGMSLAYFVLQPLVLHLDLKFLSNVGSVPFFNGLMTTFLIPALLIFVAQRKGVSVGLMRQGIHTQIYSAIGALLAFLYLDLSVRHLFHGTDLWLGETTSIERLVISLSWMIVGVFVIWFGVIKKEVFPRAVGMALLALTVFKVFLFDASNLEGALRILSFLGLGITLLGLGYLYPRLLKMKKK